MSDYEAPCEVSGGFDIPGCWSAVLYGPEACFCEGSPNAIAMDHRWAAWQRLQRMRVRRLEAQGLGVIGGGNVVGGGRHDAPSARVVRVPLRVVR